MIFNLKHVNTNEGVTKTTKAFDGIKIKFISKNYISRKTKMMVVNTILRSVPTYSAVQKNESQNTRVKNKLFRKSERNNDERLNQKHRIKGGAHD